MMIFTNHTFIMYSILIVMILINIAIFPDILNNQEIKINDFSYLIERNAQILPDTIIKAIDNEKVNQINK